MATNTATVPIYSFKGIPFGQPPVGALRFMPTVPISYAQNRTFMATQFANTCPNPFNPANVTEDCLYLNVWTPTLTPGANLSVMFWIYGSGFTWWGTNMFDGQQLAIRQVVVVTVAYRLGAFGWLCTDRADAPGNMGLYDQLTGLQWTVKGLDDFLIPPKRQIAQAFPISNNEGLGMRQNACANLPQVYSNVQNGVATAKRYAAYVGCDPNGDYLGCLRAIPAAQLLAAQTSAPIWNQAGGQPIQLYADGAPFTICYGTNFLPSDPLTLLKTPAFRPDLRVMIGHVYNEDVVFGAGVNLVAPVMGRYVGQVRGALTNRRLAIANIMTVFVNTGFGPTLAAQYTAFNATAPALANSTRINAALRATVMHALSDYLFVCPTVLFGQYLTQYSNFAVPVNQYYLRYANSQSPCYGSDWCLGATHLDDIPLVFGRPFYQTGFTDTDRFMSATVMNIWTMFAKTGFNPVLDIYKKRTWCRSPVNRICSY
ncbi:unnamed protein product [Medioppia subpectinata]|uniref:Carboxylesterase type B domain-containing protein n=1 Tax=Medioppia subpectinata TaxID=1979941 RepID=A0A7R9PUR5_9ACAR|nr:unnamed protein product [Medioppia subpectinata]CAG2101508.1 unnamed protein product [Medioppia subpectinata]